MPFVNDTHLANDPGRDPDFDRGLPRSPFQQIVTWRVPNSRQFGGQGNHGENGNGRCADKPHDSWDGPDDRTYRAAKQPKLSNNAIQKSRTRIGRRVGAGYRKVGP